MGKDPYACKQVTQSLYKCKQDVTGKLVAVLEGGHPQRGLELIITPSRAVRRSEIHELLMTDEAQAAPGTGVNAISYLGFVEIEQGGILLRGDTVLLEGAPIGVIAGFDETHMPNHLNVVLRCDRLNLSSALGAAVGQHLRFTFG